MQHENNTSVTLQPIPAERLYLQRIYFIPKWYICQHTALVYDMFFLTNTDRRNSHMYERLRALREDNDLRQQDIARVLNCTQVCYSRYESGHRDIPAEALITLAGFYRTSVDYILGVTDCKKPYPKTKQPGC